MFINAELWNLLKTFFIHFRREITALQFENYSLERQLFSYQKSLSTSRAKQQLSQHSEDIEDDEDYPDDHYSHEHYNDRSLSEAQSFSESEYVWKIWQPLYNYNRLIDQIQLDIFAQWWTVQNVYILLPLYKYEKLLHLLSITRQRLYGFVK